MPQRGLTALVLFFHWDSVPAPDAPRNLCVLHVFLSPRRQKRLFCLRHWIHVCKSGLSAHVMLFLNCHGGRSWVFAPVVGFTCAVPAFLPLSSFIDIVPNCGSNCGKSPLRGLRNSPRAMPLFGAPHCPIAFSSHKSLRKRLRGYVLTGLLLFVKNRTT